MKYAICVVLIFGTVLSTNGKLHCHLPAAEVPTTWISMVDPCIKIVSDQVTHELNAAMTYMAMGAHFSRDTINRPGFADFFFKSASEEREHAMALINYLSMRGQLTREISKLIKNPKPVWSTWESGFAALKDALILENQVTNKIRDIIKVCEAPEGSSFNDYHIVDYLTGDFLEEQYKGQRELAGMASTLGKMMDHHGSVGEFLFDKKLLKNEL